MCILHYNFKSEYELMLSAWGEGELHEQGLIANLTEVFSEFKNKYKRKPNDISLELEDSMSFGYGFTSIDSAFLEKLGTLKELILPDSVTDIKMTPVLEKRFKENDILIRGNFDSFAEKFAAEYGLHFRPSNFVFAEHFFEPAQESTRMTIIFRRNGSVTIEEKITSPGSSAGNTFGGEFYYSLPSDFYMTQTVDDIAERFRNAIYNSTILDGRLETFMENVKTHNIYTGKN